MNPVLILMCIFVGPIILVGILLIFLHVTEFILTIIIEMYLLFLWIFMHDTYIRVERLKAIKKLRANIKSIKSDKKRLAWHYSNRSSDPYVKYDYDAIKKDEESIKKCEAENVELRIKLTKLIPKRKTLQTI